MNEVLAVSHGKSQADRLRCAFLACYVAVLTRADAAADGCSEGGHGELVELAVRLGKRFGVTPAEARALLALPESAIAKLFRDAPRDGR